MQTSHRAPLALLLVLLLLPGVAWANAVSYAVPLAMVILPSHIGLTTKLGAR